MEFLLADWLGLIAGGVGWSLWQTGGTPCVPIEAD